MPVCPALPSLSVATMVTTDPLRVVIVGGITLVVLGLGVVATYQAFASAAHRKHATALGLGAVSMLALALALFVDVVVLDVYVAAGQHWLAASLTSTTSTCVAAVPAQLAHIHAVETSLRTIDYTAALVFVVGILAMLAVDRTWVRREARASV